MLLLVAAHFVAALVAPLLVRWQATRAFLALALVPASGMVWLAVNLSTIRSTGAVQESVTWIPTLGLDLDLRIDALSAVMVALVTGVGALVLVYCRWYFTTSSEGLGRFGFSFLGFAGSMLGLVVADNLLLLYVFWELTTLFSYLLIGQYFGLRTSRRAAMQALVVTTFGGLAMLVGFILLGVSTGSFDASYVVAHPPDGGVAVTAAVLVMLGALSKSAIVPFHFWLPAAMAAPTPVSAYLHAAAMVKGGVFLVARFSPGFADLPVWRWTLVVLGGAGLLLGAWVALRQHDLKLLLAWGTVSQLGLLVLVYGIGSPDAALAGTALLAAHALYKSTLFLVVGIVEHDNGTRDLRALSGAGRRAPVLAAVAGLAVASMMGIPPLLGFVAKEAMYGAALAAPLGGAVGVAVIVSVLVAGTALTVAYGVRFFWGAFGTRVLTPGAAPHGHLSPRAILLAPAVLSALGLVGGLTVVLWAPFLEQYAVTVPGTLTVGLSLWHGVTGALGLSVLGLALGSVVAYVLARTGPRPGLLPETWEAQWRYRRLMRGLDRLAVEVTGATQRGSLPFYLGTAVVVLSVVLLWTLAHDTWPAQWRLWESPTQAWAALLAIPVVVAATRVRQRLTAVLLVGATGYVMVVIFVLQGAPDLALTQALVETCTLVVFVLVLRKLPKQIRRRHTRQQELRRLLIAVPAGVLIAVAGAVALAARREPAVSDLFPGPAYDFGGGRNIVNVILVDIRAWDTFGEISVLIAAATGVASLIFLERRTGAPPQLDESSSRRDTLPVDRTFLRGGLAVPAENRSVILEVATRVLFPTMIVLSLYLLLAGHNVPGGGFAGGLVAGLALVLRYLAAGRYELGEAAPVEAGMVLGAGLLLAGGTGAVALVVGGDVFESTILQLSLPLFGDVKVVSALFFDVGVYLVVIGLVLDILRSLGAELDRRDEDDDEGGIDDVDVAPAPVAPAGDPSGVPS